MSLSEEDKAKYIPIIDVILKSSDLSTISIKQVRARLSEHTGVDFTPAKKLIDPLVTQRFDILLAERDNPIKEEEEDVKEEDEPGSPATVSHGDYDVLIKEELKLEVGEELLSSSPDPSYSPYTASPKKRKSSSVDEDARLAAELHAQLNGGRPSRGTAAKPKKAAAKNKRAKKKSKDVVDSDGSGEDSGKPIKKRKVNANNAFMKPLMLSETLAAFVGEAQMSRPGVVKMIWAHIKQHDLQDPADRRYIICDEVLRPLFGDKVHMFTMNKLLAANMYKAEEVAQPQPPPEPQSFLEEFPMP